MSKPGKGERWRTAAEQARANAATFQQRLEMAVAVLRRQSEWIEAHKEDAVWGDAIRDTIAWAGETFKGATPLTAARHLLREAIELEVQCEALALAVVAQSDVERTSEKLAEELADVFMVACHVAKLADVDVTEAVKKKLAKNQGRKWGEPDAEGVREHVRDLDDPRVAAEQRPAE